MKQNKLIICWLLFLSLLWCLAWTNTLKTSTPAGGDDPREADDRMREIKGAFVERLDVDHYWTASAASTYDAADTGKHEFITLIDMHDDPTAAAGYAHIYMKGDELFYQDDTDTTCMLTKDGQIEWESINDVNNNTYIVAVDNAGTGTVDLIKADVNDLAILSDGASLDSATASGDGDRTIADKGYVDGEITDNTTMVPAVTGEGTGVDGDTVSVTLANGLIMKWGVESVASNALDEVTYPVAFPTACLQALCTYKHTGLTTTYSASCMPKVGSEATILQVQNRTAATRNIAWFAIGY